MRVRLRMEMRHLSLVLARVSMEVRMPAKETSIPLTEYGISKNFVPSKGH